MSKLTLWSLVGGRGLLKARVPGYWLPLARGPVLATSFFPNRCAVAV